MLWPVCDRNGSGCNGAIIQQLQIWWNELRTRKASEQTPTSDTLPTTSLPSVPPSIPPQRGLKTPILSTTTVPLHPITPSNPQLTTTIPLQSQLNPKIVQCIQTNIRQDLAEDTCELCSNDNTGRIGLYNTFFLRRNLLDSR